MRKLWSVPVFAVLLAVANVAGAQAPVERTLEIDGDVLRFAVRGFPADAHLGSKGQPEDAASPLQTSIAISRLLAAGKVEEAALLSNAPRRRFEVLRDYQRSVGDEGFKRVFAEFSDPGNRVLAEVTIGRHSLLVWELRERDHFAGQYYVEVEGKVYMDDVPGQARLQLRRVLEGIRAGRIALPAP